MEFTFDYYRTLINKLVISEYYLTNFIDFITLDSINNKLVILRHDVDRLPENALVMANIEKECDISSTYYFRSVNSVFKVNILKKIADLGHEIGYHYEEMDFSNGDKDKAFEIFQENLEKFRKIYPVKTICMHGSPLSKFDNKDLWKKYNYRDHGIIGEPYFDVNWNEMFYLTDTGRKWNQDNISVRDKVDSSKQYTEISKQINSTQGIINLANEGKLPDKIMINTHPHRWFNFGIGWVKELVKQNIKNTVKYFLIKSR